MAKPSKKSVHEVGPQSPSTLPDFDSIYRNYWQRIYSLCLALTRDSVLAEDLTQDAFLVLLNKYHTFRGESALYTWFYRVAFNLVLMQRRKRHLTETSLDELLQASPGLFHEGSPLACDDARLQNTPERILLERAIGTLTAGSKTVLLLHAVEGFTHEEIARRLGFSTNTSKSQLHRARKKLEGILGRVQAVGGATGRSALQANKHTWSNPGRPASSGNELSREDLARQNC
jgi:RNA polymerase sigma-70 factor, ECF subfamily